MTSARSRAHMRLYPVSQLYEFTPRVEATTSSGRNPLSSAGALTEAEFIDMRLSPQRSRAGILFDTRLCVDLKDSNAALVVVVGVAKILWSNDDRARQQPWRARYGSLEPRVSTGGETPLPIWSPTGRESTWALDVSDASGPAATSPSPHGNEIDGSPDYILEFGPLFVSGLSAQIYIGRVDGLDDGIPDMGELPDTEIIAGFPQWSSLMAVHEHHTYPDPAVDG
jgi:hypothetical protein